MSQPHRAMHHLYKLLVKAARYLHVYLTLFGFGLLMFFAITGFMLNHEDWFLQQKQDGTLPVELLISPEANKEAIVSKLRRDFAIDGELETFDFVKDDNGKDKDDSAKEKEENQDVTSEKVKEAKEKDNNNNNEIRVVFKASECCASVTIKQKDGKTLVLREKEQVIKGKLPMELLKKQWDEEKKFHIVEKLRSDYSVHGKAQFDYPRDGDPITVVFKAPGGYLATATIQEKDGEVTVAHKTNGTLGLFMDLHRGKDSGKEWSLLIDGVSILFVIVSITGLILWTSLRARAQHGLAVMALGLAMALAIYFCYVPR
jgi:hypothetical protein